MWFESQAPLEHMCGALRLQPFWRKVLQCGVLTPTGQAGQGLRRLLSYLLLSLPSLLFLEKDVYEITLLSVCLFYIKAKLQLPAC